MTIDEEKKRINGFFKKYGKCYDYDTFKFISSRIDEDIERIDCIDVVRQIYSYLRIIPEELDLYLRFIKFIADNYGLNKNIIEVGGGLFPTLAHHVYKKQIRLNCGSITIYDKRLITEEIKGIKLYKQEFTLNTDISKYDLIIGMMPCDATELIIKSAGIYDKEFVIAMCGCTPLNYPDYSYDVFFKYIESLAKDSVGRNQNVFIEYFSEEFCNPYPIIMSKRKSLK